jgi:hypothetical protein
MERLSEFAEVVGMLSTIDLKTLLAVKTLLHALQTLGSTDPQMTAAGMAPPTQHTPMMAGNPCPQGAQTPATQQTQQTPVMDHPRPQGAPASPERTQDMKNIINRLIHHENLADINLGLRNEGRKKTIAIAAYMHKFLGDRKLDEADLADEVLYERVAVILTDIREYLDGKEDLSKQDLDDVMVAFGTEARSGGDL